MFEVHIWDQAIYAIESFSRKYGVRIILMVRTSLEMDGPINFDTYSLGGS